MLLIVIEDARASLKSEHDVMYAGFIIFKLLKYFISGVIFKMTSRESHKY